jgi:hypothetical protein
MKVLNLAGVRNILITSVEDVSRENIFRLGNKQVVNPALTTTSALHIVTDL